MKLLAIATFSLFLCVVATSDSWAAIKLDSETANEIKSLRSDLEEKQESIKNLNNEIERLESDLGQHNDRYVQVIRLKRQIENNIYDIRINLDRNQQKVDERIVSTKKIIQAAVLGQLESDHSPSMLLGEKIIFEQLGLELELLLENRRQQDEVSQKLTALQKRYTEYESIEKELASLLAGLEGQRELTTSHYMKLTDQKNRTQSKYDTLKTKVFLNTQQESLAAREQVGGILFGTPIEDFSGMEHQDKGVTFRYRGQREVVNSAKGEVVYKGKLSTYGNVVMVDHGNDTRSVFLGHFQPQVKKGKMLQRGDLIGHTPQGRSEGEIYFEVRKHNEVQNTILLLDQERLLASVLDARG